MNSVCAITGCFCLYLKGTRPNAMKSDQRVNNTPVSGFVSVVLELEKQPHCTSSNLQQFTNPSRNQCCSWPKRCKRQRTICTFSDQVKSKLAICIGRVLAERCVCSTKRRSQIRTKKKKTKMQRTNPHLQTVAPGWMLTVTGGPFCFSPPCCTARMWLGSLTENTHPLLPPRHAGGLC